MVRKVYSLQHVSRTFNAVENLRNQFLYTPKSNQRSGSGKGEDMVVFALIPDVF